MEACELPAATAQAIVKKEVFKRAEKELAAIRAIPGCRLVNWSEPEYPQTLLQIYDPPVVLYVRGDAQIPRLIDDIVERTGLNSSDLLATLFDLEMKGFVRQLPGKQFSKIML